MSGAPLVESAAVQQACALTAICDRPAQVGPYCDIHREEINERTRRERDDIFRSQRGFWLREIGVPLTYDGATFESARPTPAVKVAHAYLVGGRGISRGRALISAAATGGGKTYSHVCIVNALLPYFRTAQRFVLGAQLARELTEYRSASDAMEEYAHVRVLVIDDLQVPHRPEGIAAIEELLIRREADGKPVVISTNLRKAAFASGFGDRVMDRLRSWGEYHELAGKSLRGGSVA